MEIGDRVLYVKTHEGHRCTVTGTVYDRENRLVKVGVRCDCGSDLWLNPWNVKAREG